MEFKDTGYLENKFKDIQTEDWRSIDKEEKYFRLPERLIEKISDNFPVGASVLDLGCGDGNLLEQLKNNRKKLEITGADTSEKRMAYAKKRVPEAAYFTLDITEQNIPKKFDVIFMKLVLGCLRNKKYSSQEELCDDVLKKIKESCDYFVLVTPVLKEGVDPRSVEQIFMSRDVLDRLMDKHFGKIKEEILLNEEYKEKQGMDLKVYFLTEPKK